MKKIQFLLLAIIFMSIAGKVSLRPIQKVNYAALSTDTKLEDVQQFFKYKVNPVQVENPYRLRSCMVQTSVCCHT